MTILQEYAELQKAVDELNRTVQNFSKSFAMGGSAAEAHIFEVENRVDPDEHDCHLVGGGGESGCNHPSHRE